MGPLPKPPIFFLCLSPCLLYFNFASPTVLSHTLPFTSLPYTNLASLPLSSSPLSSPHFHYLSYTHIPLNYPTLPYHLPYASSHRISSPLLPLLYLTLSSRLFPSSPYLPSHPLRSLPSPLPYSTLPSTTIPSPHMCVCLYVCMYAVSMSA